MKYTATVLFVMIVTALTAISPAHGQKSLTPATLKVIDSSLTLLDMKRSDCAMPYDAVKMDVHRLKFITSLFADPLKSFDMTQQHADRLQALADSTVDEYAAELMQQMGLGEYSAAYLETGITAKQLDAMLGIDLDSLAGFIGASVVRKYLIPLVQAEIATRNSLKNIVSNHLLYDNADSLLMLSSDSQNASVYELKAEEERGTILTRKFFDEAAKVQIDQVYSSGFSLYRTYLHFMKSMNSAAQLARDSVRSVVLNTKLGRIALGGRGNDIYQGEYLLIIDVGGNDKYLLSERTKTTAKNHPVQVCIDLGGDDVYLGGNYSLGGAIFGTNILIDADGDDLYSAGDFSLGCGIFGLGIVHDLSGNDHYTSKTCTQGAGFFGVGLLIDDSGNDSYTAQAHCQGFGSTRGFGAIADKMGNDVYVASSPFQDFLRYESHFESFAQGAGLGFRPIASGGIGLLLDYKGNDSYLSDIYGQGTAYWFCLGALYDADGDDRYQSYQYSQGAGVHLAHGILWDKKGDDVYYSHGVSQGCGHDIAFGCLLDESGDDSYTAESLSLGGGNANAVSLFVDNSGNDSYVARNTSNTMGFSDFRRNYGMIGIFADGGGNDVYGEAKRNNSTEKKSTFGLFADMELNTPKITPSTEPALTPPDSLKEPLRSTIDSLFIQASAAPQKYQYNVEPARAMIVGMGASALPFLADKLATESPRERLALDGILPRLYDRDTAAVEKLLLDSLDSPVYETMAMCASILARKKVDSAMIKFLDMLHDKEWRIRSLAAQQIGELGRKDAAGELALLLRDNHPSVRARAAFALGQLLPDNIAELMIPAFTDDAQIVRNSAIQSLKRQKKYTLEVLGTLFRDSIPEKVRRELTVLFPTVESTIDTSDSKTEMTLAEIIRSQPRTLRSNIYRELGLRENKLWKKTLEECRKSETVQELMQLLPPKPEKKKKKNKAPVEGS
ncbi:MAG: HEAT repeat domain-containing protein [Candidatus Kapaibacterium sp.]